MSGSLNHVAEKSFADAETMAAALAADIAGRLKAGVAARGAAVLAVSGGKSPVRLFQLLSKADVPWSSVTVTLVDERWVPPTDEASNERLVYEHLLVGKAATARFVSLKNDAATPEAGAAECHAALARLTLPFDVIVLGMGDDGHTASLFPHAPGLEQGLTTTDLCAAVRPQTAPHPRLSLSLKALQSCRWLVLPLTGAGKLKTYRTALENGPVEDMPVRAVLRQTAAPMEVWISN